MINEVANDILTLSIFILGLITVVLSLIVSAKFNRYKNNLDGKAKDLSRAVSWQLMGEAIIGFGTLVFATAAFFEVLSSWSIMTQSFIRFVMFFATSITTLHLLRTLKNISDD